jgi:hypothetical protein
MARTRRNRSSGRGIIAALAWPVLLGGLGTLLILGVPRLRTPRTAPPAISVAFTTLPDWLDGNLVTELEIVVRESLVGVRIERSPLLHTAENLRATGYFAEVRQVSWLSETCVAVDATFLAPYARVLHGEQEWFADVEGHVLPKRAEPLVRGNYHFITIVGLQHAPPACAGAQWMGGDLASALSLLRVIYAKPWAVQVKQVDVAMWRENGHIALLTDTPCRIVWGSAPGSEQALEALAAEKVRRLDHFVASHGRIDRGKSETLQLTEGAGVVAWR